MPITKTIDRNRNLTVFTVQGKAPFAEFRDGIAEFYRKDPTDSVIFDLREAEGEGEEFSHERITRLVDFVEATRKGRQKGRTAMVAQKDLLYGICRMVESYLHPGGVEYRTFRSLEQAMAWIEGGD